MEMLKLAVKEPPSEPKVEGDGGLISSSHRYLSMALFLSFFFFFGKVC